MKTTTTTDPKAAWCEAHNDGVKAYAAGINPLYNPYSGSLSLGLAWIAGYNSARGDAAKTFAQETK